MQNVDSKTAGVICLDRTENIQNWLPLVIVIKTVECQRCWPGLCVFNFSCWESNIIVLLISRRTFLHFKSPTRERESIVMASYTLSIFQSFVMIFHLVVGNGKIIV